MNKFDNIGEMDKFLEKFKLQKLSKKETENLNKCMSSNETELVILNLSIMKI